MPVSPDYGPIDFSSRKTEQEQIDAAGKIYQLWSEKTKPYLLPGAAPDVAGIKDALEVVVHLRLEIQDLKGKKSSVADEIESRINMLVRSRLRALVKLLFTAGESFVDVKAAVIAAAGGVKDTEDDYLGILIDVADDAGVSRPPTPARTATTGTPTTPTTPVTPVPGPTAGGAGGSPVTPGTSPSSELKVSPEIVAFEAASRTLSTKLTNPNYDPRREPVVLAQFYEVATIAEEFVEFAKDRSTFSESKTIKANINSLRKQIEARAKEIDERAFDLWKNNPAIVARKTSVNGLKSRHVPGMSVADLRTLATEITTEIQELERIKNTAEAAIDPIQQAVLAEGISKAELFIFKTKQLEYLSVLIDSLKPIIEAAKPKEKDPAHMSDLERQLLRIDSLLGVLGEAETTSGLEGTRALAYREAIKVRTENLLDKYPAEARSWNEDERKAFAELTENLSALFEYGVLQPKSIDARRIVIENVDALLGNPTTKTKGAIELVSSGSSSYKYNDALNKNLLINSVGIDDEQYKPGMGIVQDICCAMYYLMKTAGSTGGAGRVIGQDKDGKNIIGKYSTYDRTGEYADDQAAELVQYICSLDTLGVKDANGRDVVLNLKQRISKFPQEVQEVIKYVALLKASRDDLGQKASNYIQLREGKSPKIGSGKGANGTAWHSGYLSRTIYKAAQTANNKEHMIVLGYIDPTNIPEFQLSRLGPRTLANAQKYDDFKLRIDEIEDKMQLMNAYFEYSRETWPDIRRSLECKPTRWNHDFPAPDEFFNIDRGEKKNPSTYTGARDSWVAVKDASYKTLNLKLPSDRTIMRREIESLLSDLFTQCALMTAYLGPGYATGGTDDRYIPYHQIPRSALKLTLFNIITAVPGTIMNPKEDATLFTRFFGEGNNDQVYSRRKYAIRIIMEQIRKYPSLGSPEKVGTYAHELTQFLSREDLWHTNYKKALSKLWKYNSKRISHSSTMKDLSEEEQSREMGAPLVYPFDPVADKSND